MSAMSDLLAALARSLVAQFEQLDALGLHGDARRVAVGRVFRAARDSGTTVPAVMARVMEQWAESGRVPEWLTAPEAGAGDE